MVYSASRGARWVFGYVPAGQLRAHPSPSSAGDFKKPLAPSWHPIKQTWLWGEELQSAFLCFVFLNQGRSWLGKAGGAAAGAPSWELFAEILVTDLGQKRPSLAKFPSPSAIASGDAEPTLPRA